ncbi:MAG: ABC transporter ATP-binding protein [Proteobacteria bacterium]|nr:ABC transporter ATP-binding protein [Pseudomonadota bacterium]
MKTENILSLSQIHSYVDQHHILQGITMEVKKGEVTTLLGRNGAGKSSTLKSIMGIYPTQKGQILFADQMINKMDSFEVARLGVGYVPEDQSIFYHLTVEENMRLAMLKLDEKTTARKKRMLELFPDLKKFWKSKGGVLSGGQRQMLAIARAVVNENQLLLIDEPSKGLAPIVVDALIEAIDELKQTETIILVEQNFYMATKCGDSYHIIDDGRIVHSGRMEDLVEDENLKKKFLGIGVS